MSSSSASEWVVAQIPTGHPDPKTTFKLQPISSPPTSATPGHLLLHLKVVSVDPYLRGSLRSAPVGQPLSSYCIAEVVDSQLDGYIKGDLVTGILPWKTVQLHDSKQTSGLPLRKVSALPGVSLTAYVGVLGMPGRTAYFGLLDHEVGRFQPGQTVVVSGAAGAVGSLVGQLAKLKGAKRVIGTAGGPEKCRLVVERYGFDACLDYKALDTTEAMAEALRKEAPQGVQLYFDNTGGHVTRAALEVLAKFGRLALCGSISGYNHDPKAKENLVPDPLQLGLVYRGINIRGFTVSDFVSRYDEFYAEVPQLVEQGKIRYDETTYKGFAKVPEAFAGLFLGHNTGKAIVTVD